MRDVKRMRREVLCTCDYEEDGELYWSAGCTYAATKHRDGTWSIETNFGNIGKVGPYNLLTEFD